MGRPRDFDTGEALDAAVRLFWDRGFVATSVRDLCDVMGIKPGSFYAAFGGKEACFREALGRYLESQPRPGPPGPEAIRAWLRAIVDPKRVPRGCLLVNSAVEHPRLDADTQALVIARMDALQKFFALCLRGRSTARSDAALVGAAVLAIHVRARAGASTRELRALARRALAAIGLDPRLDPARGGASGRLASS